MSRRFPDFSNPAPEPWGWKDRFYSGLIAVVMLCFIVVTTAFILLVRFPNG